MSVRPRVDALFLESQFVHSLAYRSRRGQPQYAPALPLVAPALPPGASAPSAPVELERRGWLRAAALLLIGALMGAGGVLVASEPRALSPPGRRARELHARLSHRTSPHDGARSPSAPAPVLV